MLGDDQSRIMLRQVDQIAFATSAQIDPINAIGKFANDANTHGSVIKARSVTLHARTLVFVTTDVIGS